MQDFDQTIAVFLATCRTASLATRSTTGQPCAANVQYAEDERWRLYWVSGETSQHSRNLASDSRAAMTIYAHDDQAATIHGLQLQGHAVALAELDECRDAWERYTEKLAFLRADPQLRDVVRQQTFYRFTPHWLRWIDNREHFGFKIEKTL